MKNLKKSMNQKMSARLKLAAKNQPDWSRGQIRNTETKTTIGAEKAIAL